MKTYLLKTGVRQAIAKAGETDIAVAYNAKAWVDEYPAGNPQLMVTTPGGKRVPVTVEAVDNLITGQVPNELLAGPGVYSYVFVWTSGSTQLESGRCECLVLGSNLAKDLAHDSRRTPDWAERIFLAAEVIEGAVNGAMEARNTAADMAAEAETHRTAAENAQEAAETAQDGAEAAEQRAIDVRDSIPETYTELSDQVDNLKSAVNAYNYDVPGLSWSLGSYDSSTGNRNTGVTNRICTDYLVPGEDGYLYVATTDPTNVTFWVNRYTDANVFDGNVKSNSDLSYEGYNKGKRYTITVRYKGDRGSDPISDVSALSSLMIVKTHFVGYDNLDANLQEAADIALEKTVYLHGTVATDTDLNTIISQGIYSLAASRNYPNRPPEIKTGSILRVTPYSSTIIEQRIETLQGDIMMGRRLSDESWSDWKYIQYNYPAVFRNIGSSADEWVAGSCDTSDGNVTLSSTRISLLYIPVFNPQNNLMITLKNSAAKFWVTRFDTNLNYVSTIISPTSTVGVTTLNPGYIYSITLAYYGNDTITDSNIDTLISYMDIKSILTKQGEIYKDHDYDSVLTGKKWAVCGDSYSEGDYSDESSVTSYTIRKGKYFGELCVYPYLIGNRTGVDIEMLARRGMTLASVPAKQGNCFAEGAYQNIPDGADYITLWFGINDKLQSVGIGNESSTDITTFCGAWNTVLSYIREKHPFAHVGIVVSNNAGDAQAPYSAATRTMAKKYGYPVLDMQADTQIPLMLNDMERDGLSGSVRTDVYRVQALENGHPNAQAHEFESYFIENWLHSL